MISKIPHLFLLFVTLTFTASALNAENKYVSFKTEEEKISFIKETLKIVDPELPAAKRVNDIFNELIIARFGKELKKPVKLFISDIPGIKNAFAFTDIKSEIIIGITKDILTQFSVDRVAFFTGHEIGHFLIDSEENSKTEEYAADINSVYLMANAQPQFSLDAAVEAAKLVFIPKGVKSSETREFVDAVLGIFDVHGVSDVRVAEIRNTASVLEHQRGLKNIAETSWPESFNEDLKTLQHESFVDKVLKQSHFANATSLEQVKILVNLLKTFDSNTNDHILQIRIKDILSYLKKVARVGMSDPDAKAFFEDAINFVLRGKYLPKSLKFQSRAEVYQTLLYESMARIFKNSTSLSLPAYGRLRELKRLLQNFVRADDFNEAKEFAADLQKFLKKDPIVRNVQGRHLLSKIDWQIDEFDFHHQIRLNKKDDLYYEKIEGEWEPTILPWEDYIKWSQWSTDIADSLWDSGVKDHRIFPRMSFEYRYKNFIKFGVESNLSTPALNQAPKVKESDMNLVIKFSRTEKDVQAATHGITSDGYLVAPNSEYKITFLSSLLEAVGKTYIEAQDLDTNEKDLTKMKSAKVAAEVIGFTADLLENKDLKSFQFSLVDKYMDVNFLKTMPAQNYIQLNSFLITSATKSNFLQSQDHYFKIVGAFVYDLNKLLTENPNDTDLNDKIKTVIDAHFATVRGNLPLSPFNPLCNFVIEEKFNVFTLKDKLNLLEYSGYADLGESFQNNPDGKITFLNHSSYNKIRSLFGYHKPKSTQELTKIVQHLLSLNLDFAEYFGLYEAALFITENKDKVVDLYMLFKNSEAITPDDDRELKKMDEYTTEILAIFTKHIESDRFWSKRDLVNRMEVFDFFSQIQLFKQDLIFRHRVAARIFKDIQSTSDEMQKISFLSRLLQEPRIQDPSLRGNIIDDLVHSLKTYLGQDDDSPRFFSLFKKTWEDVASKINLADKVIVAAKLAREVLTQKNLSYYLRDHLLPKDLNKNLSQFDDSIRLQETFNVITRYSEDLRMSVFEFLFSPLSQNSISAFLGNTETEAVIFLREILTISESLADEVYENASDIPKKKVYRYWSTLFYQNFWSYPFEIRTLIIERLLTVGDSEAHFEKAFHLIVKRLFPDGTQYAKEAHEILQTYLSILKIGQKSLFLSALIATAEQAQEKQSSAGEKLAMILELMGPAEIKLGQQINSFPQTPEDIRKPVGRLKTNAREPFRWDIFELRDKVLPPEELANIKWTGSVLGSASYYVTFEYKTPAGKKEVLSLLRPWSKDRADQGFAHLLKFLEQFSGDPVLRDTIADLTKEAQKNVVVETSHEFAQKQFANSKRVYNNKSIVVKGSGVKDLNISLNFVDLLAAGPGYRRMSIAEGVHFSELPSTTPEQKALKQDIARAYLIMEFYAILRGYEFDHDRHGGQMRVLVKDPHNVEIGLFDAGAMSLEPPTTLMRKALGKLWFECIMEMYSNSELQNSDLGKIILEKRKAFSQKLNGGLSAEEREKFDRYLISVEKALLTLGEFMQEFDEDKRTQELTNIVRTILKEDLIHPEIKKGFDAKGLEKMGAFYGVILEQFKNTDDCSKSFVLGNFP